MTLTPAYGRDYKSKKEVLEAWESGVDFYANSPTESGYCSIRDFPEGEGRHLQLRYKKLTMVVCITR
jgi:hypothetical protein